LQCFYLNFPFRINGLRLHLNKPLTTNTDTFNGTTSDDTFIGDFTATATANGSDTLDGKAGTDTLKLYGNYATASMPVSVSNVEVLELVNNTTDFDMTARNTLFDAFSTLRFSTVDATGGAEAFIVKAGQVVELATAGNAAFGGASTVTVTYATTDTTVSTNLRGFAGGTGVTSDGAVTIVGAAATTVNVGSVIGNNGITTLTLPGTATKLVITGDKNLTVNTDTAGTVLATIDAAAATGKVNMIVNSTAANLSFTGGSADDTVIFGATNTFTSSDTVVGGGGTDTLGIQRAQAIATSAFTNITGFETLRVNDATTAADVIDISLFGGIKNISFAAAATNLTTVNKLATDAIVTLSTTSGVDLNLATDGTNDTLNLHVSGAGVTYTVDATTWENIAINTGAATGTSTFAITDPQLKTVTVDNTNLTTGLKNNQAVNLGTLGTVVSSVDLTNFSAATATNGVTAAGAATGAVNGITYTGSGNLDSLTGSSFADTINGNAGADRLYGDNGGTKRTETFTLATAGDNGDTFTATILGFASTGSIATGALAAADAATALGAAINANTNLTGLATASVTGAVVTVTYLVDGNTAGTAGTTSVKTTNTLAQVTAGTAGTTSADTINGGTGADVIVGGGGADSLTGGTGNDTFFFLKAQSTNASLATIEDFKRVTGGETDIITLGDVTTAIGSTTTVQDLSSQATFAAALASAAATNTVNNGLSVFIYGGNEYVYVETTGATTTYVAGDFLVKLTGTPIASGAALAGKGIDGL